MRVIKSPPPPFLFYFYYLYYLVHIVLVRDFSFFGAAVFTDSGGDACILHAMTEWTAHYKHWVVSSY